MLFLVSCISNLSAQANSALLRSQSRDSLYVQAKLNQKEEKLDEDFLRSKEALKNLKAQQAYEQEQLEIKKKWTDELISLQKSRILILSILFGVSLLFVLILYRLFSAKEHHNNELQTLNYHLNSSNNMLEMSVDELNQTNETLLQNNQALNNFATVAAHDLKGPLRSIISFSQLLQRSLDGKIEESEKDYFEYINTNTRKLATLIDDLLNFSSLGRQMPPPERIDLNKITKDVIASLQQTIEDQNAEFHISKLPTVQAHYSLMIQVFQNIISNSLKFAQEERKSIITINAFSLSAKRIQVSIQDNGIGIPEDQQAQVFELFARLNTPDDYEGSGVGLATCRKIVRYYGGKMMISSTEGEGTTIFFDLPLVTRKAEKFHVITINES